MSKIRLTKELSNLIRNTRLNNKIKAIELAKYLNKSISYVSKLENSDLKYIDFKLVENILKFLTKNSNEDFQSFINKTIEKFHIEEIDENKIKEEEQDWIIKFELEIRQIPISNQLINFIKEELSQLNISSKKLIEIINENKDIQNMNIDFNKYAKNTGIEIDNNSVIIFDLNKNIIDDILNKKLKSVNYITMRGIIYYIFRLKKYNEEDSYKKTNEILNKYKFFTLGEKFHYLQQNQGKSELNTILNEYDTENIKYIKKILSTINVLSDWKIEYVNKFLKQLSDSFDIDDKPFILAIIGKEFYKLQNLNKNDKKRFLHELDDLVNSFSKIEYDQIDEFNEY